MTPKEIKKIRGRKTQMSFALMYGIAPTVLNSWEKGHYKPRKICKLWLRVIQANPKLAREIAMELVENEEN